MTQQEEIQNSRNGAPSRDDGINWAHTAVTSLTTVTLSIIAGVAIFYFTRQPTPMPTLYYEQVPPTAFFTAKVQTVIQSFRVWNEGTKEAEDVQVAITLPADAVVADQKVETSGGPAIDVLVKSLNEETLIADIPLLNPGEAITFALLLDGTTDRSLGLDVRGRGVIGEERPATVPTASTDIEPIILAFLGALFVAMMSLLMAATASRLSMNRRLRILNARVDYLAGLQQVVDEHLEASRR